MDQTGWNMIFGTKGSIDLLLNEKANKTQFAEDTDCYTPSVQFYKSCEHDTISTMTTPFGSGKAGSSVTYKLQDAIDFVSCIWTEPVFEPFSKLTEDSDEILHCVNAVPYAQVQRISLQCGSTEIAAMDDMIGYSTCLFLNGPNRLVEEIGDYRDEGALIAAASKKQVFHAPWYFWFALDRADALRICMVGNQGLNAKVYFDSFDKWLINSGDDTVWASKSSTIASTLSLGSFNLLARCHYIGKAERTYYQMSPVIKVVSTWFRYNQTVSQGTKSYTANLNVIFPTRLVLIGVRHAYALDTTKTFTGKVGVKDKFCLKSPTAGSNTITDLQMTLQNGKLLDKTANLQPQFYRTHAIREVVSNESAGNYGHLETLNFYAINLQDGVFLGNNNKSSANLSRFDQQKVNVTFADTSAENELFIYCYLTVPMMVELNQWYLPFGTQTIS
jgi:hypothetical protein